MKIRALGADDVPTMEALLTVFGEAFEDQETYSRKRPGPGYLADLLGSENFLALAALENDKVVGGLACYVLHFDIPPV